MNRVTPTERDAIDVLLEAGQRAADTIESSAQAVADILDAEPLDYPMDAMYEGYGVDELLEQMEVEVR